MVALCNTLKVSRVNKASSATTSKFNVHQSFCSHSSRAFGITSTTVDHDNLSRMDPQFGFPASPGTPLFAVSPERVNRQPIIAQSPSLPSDLAHLRDPFVTTPTKGTSDVQGKVAQYNNISNIQRRKDNEAAVKRAIMGREEAESETRRMKEENRVLRREIEEGRGRERKVAERVEVVMVGGTLLLSELRLTIWRRMSYKGQRRLMHILKLCMKKKSEERERRHLNPPVRWSNYSKN